MINQDEINSARFEDDFSNNPGETISFRYILMSHLDRIAKLASQDWHGGYWETVNGIEKYYISAREGYNHAVDCLLDFLSIYLTPEKLKEINTVRERKNAILHECKEVLWAAREDPSRVDNNVIEELRNELSEAHREMLRALLGLMKNKGFFDDDARLIDVGKK